MFAINEDELEAEPYELKHPPTMDNVSIYDNFLLLENLIPHKNYKIAVKHRLFINKKKSKNCQVLA